jgi:CHAT domain-containing protein
LINSGNVDATGTGQIDLQGTSSANNLGILFDNANIKPANTSGLLTITADDLDVNGITTIRGSGNLVLQPVIDSRNIIVGGLANAGNTSLEIGNSLLASLQDGFTGISIGRLNTASGLIFLSNNVTFTDPVTLRSQGIGGSINTSGFNFTSTGAINFLANQNITTNNITALGNNLTLSSSLGAINTSQGLLNTSSTSGNGGNISLLSPSINTNLGSINTSSTIGNAGNLSFANISNGLITIAGSDINLSSGSGLAGSLNFLAPVVINSPNLTINTSSTGTSGDVTFSNTLNGAIANANSLLVNAGSGNITFNAIGNNIALNFLTANTTGITRFNSIANLVSLTTNAGGTTQLNGIINTSGTQTYNDAVTLIGASQLNATNSAVLFNNTVDGTQNLIVNTGSGNITFNGAVGSSTILGNLTANSIGTTRFNTVNAASLLTNAGGTTELNGNITTTGAVTFNDAVILTGATQLNSVNTAIAFNSSVNGNQNLIVNSGEGDISFNDDVGNITPIGNLTANSSGVTRFNRVNAASLTTDATGTTQLNGNIATTGSQTYNDAVILNNSIQLNTTNSAFTFNNTVNSNQDLAINTGTGNINFSSPVTVRNLTTNSTGITRIDSNINAVSFETAFGGSTLLLGNVFTSGNQTYNNNLLISANTILDSSSGNGDIRFTTINNAIAGTPSNLILNVGTGNIFFNNSVGSLSDRLGDITISNANEFISSGIIAKSLTQNAGTGETQLGNDNEFTGNLNITSQRFSLTEAANLRVGNATIQAVNGVSLAVASNFSLLGSGSINIDSDSNSDSIGTFLNRGTITDNGFGGVVNIRTADPDIRSAIIASQITLTPSVTNTSIAIGSVANGNFKLQDSTLSLLQANLVTIRANGSPVSIGSNNASFATGTSLEIGTASSPASSISAIAGFTLNVDRNLSLTGNTIQLGETNVGGNLALRFTESVSQVGTISVTGSTNLIVDTNPLTNILLADFANNFGSQTSFTFINLPNDDFQNFEIRDIAEGATIALFPNQVNNLKLILDNGTIDLPTIPLTGSLTLKAREVSLNGDITTTNASLSGGRINLNRNLTTSGNLIIDNADTLKIGTDTNLDVTGNFEQIGSGSVQLGGNIVSAASVTFAQDIELIGDSSITSDGNINFDGTVNGLFGFTLDASGNFVVATGGFGTISPLQSLAIAPDSTLVSGLNSGFSTADINISTIGDVSVGDIINNGRGININSADGLITTANIDSSFTISFGNGGNVNLSAEGDVIIGNIDTSSFGDAGEVNLESRSGVISTGNIDASGISGGRVFFNAATAINAGQITTRGFEGAGGDVILDPSGDVVVASIETTGLTGGNVTLVSTGGNLKITDILNSSNILSVCAGASICTSGSISSGTISLQTGGLNPFVVGNASINGSSGVLTTGQSTLTLGTSIPVLLNSTFVQNGISITPGGFTVDPNNGLEPPKNIPNIINQAPVEEKILSVRDVFISEADRYFREGNLEKAFEVIEKAYVSELEIFTGRAIDSEAITIEKTQDLLSTVVQRTGDVAALIYPVILNDRIEILVIPPKEKGKPFSRASIAINSEKIEAIVTDYRNNLRDVGSNDYLEQSQQLYDLVIRPIKQQLEAMKVDTLVFVMDGGLRVTPPAALHDGKQFLIERYAIASIPALRVTRVEERDRKATRVLAMGLTESVAGFSALPSVDVEIKIISSSVLNGDAFLNQEFTVNNLQSQRQRGIYNILHLGTHAKFVSDTSKDSFIQFWDSRLSLRDIPKLRFDSPVIDMLALSACQTAVGNNLGISGLAVESGARSVLASLWEVSDTGTAPLMISFYKAFPDAVNKAQAMKKAQIELLEGRVSVGNSQILGIEGIPNIPLPPGLDDIDLKHPFYWSSFILVGNWL